MSVNKHLPHILVLPEDDADRQLANGFALHHALSTRRRHLQVLPEAGGWGKVLDCFEAEHISGMERFAHRYLVLIIDFDNQEDRLEEARKRIPQHLLERVFILGVLAEPETLRSDLRVSYENIGQKLAEDCWEETYTTWQHRLLCHNASELERLRKNARSILFSDSPAPYFEERL